jgi:hypothetical protein
MTDRKEKQMRNHAAWDELGTSKSKTRHTTKGRHANKRCPDDGRAFLPDPREGFGGRVSDDLAEMLAEEFVASATSGEEASADARDESFIEEVGGPFVATRPAGRPPGVVPAHVRPRRAR